MKHATTLISTILLFHATVWAQDNSNSSCIDTLFAYGISLDETDIHWLSDTIAYCRDIVELTQADTSAATIASAQILIKLESNRLMHLSANQLDANDALLTQIIHGAFIQHGLQEQTAISAISWYQIMATEWKE